MKQRILPPILLLITMTLTLTLISCKKTPPMEIAFYYMELCPGCDSYQKAEMLRGMVFSMTMTKTYTGESYNMGHGDNEASDTLFENFEKRGLPDISYSLPLLFVGDEYFVGYDEIEEKLRLLLEGEEK